MLIIDSNRYTSVLVVLTSKMSRKGLVLLSYNGSSGIAIDTQSLMIKIGDSTKGGKRIKYRKKFTGNENIHCNYISQPLFDILHDSYSYEHEAFEKLRVDNYMPQMLFVRVAGCELLPPMRYLAYYKMKTLCSCRVDFAGELPTGIKLNQSL